MKLLNTDSIKLKLDVEEEYVPVTSDEYNITEEEEKAALEALELVTQLLPMLRTKRRIRLHPMMMKMGYLLKQLPMEEEARGVPKESGEAEAVWNRYGRHALGCMLGMNHMPHMCSAYPIAQELSWADFWHVRKPSGTKKPEANEKIVIVRTDACEAFSLINSCRPFESVDPAPGPIKERPIEEFVEDNNLPERWNHVDSFMSLVKEVTDSKVIVSLQDNKKKRLQFQRELADIWYNSDRLAGNRRLDRRLANSRKSGQCNDGTISKYKSEFKK